MTRKRRKSEELNCRKRASSSKDKQVELSSKSSITSVLPDNMASYPFSMPSTSSSKHITCKEGDDTFFLDLWDANAFLLKPLRANNCKHVEDNIDLFHQARNNLITIQNDMNDMPGLMSQIPPLPVTINDDHPILRDIELKKVMFPSSLVHQVPEGHVGAYWRGFHMKVPFITNYEPVQVTLQTDQVKDIPCGTKGVVMISFDKIKVVNRLRKDFVYDTWLNYGVNYDNTWIYDKIHHEINQFCSSQSLQQVYIDIFDQIDERMKDALQADCTRYAP